MQQTLRKTFTFRSHANFKPALRNGFEAPVSLQGFLEKLQQYIDRTTSDLLQPRQSTIDRLLLEARH